jgi:predicted ATP-grasp superfamily ATP-dependent carboligase
MRVLIFDSGPTSSYHAMRSAARAGHEVHLASAESSVYFSSKYCSKAIALPPGEDHEAFTRSLVALARAERYGAALFCGDHEAEAIWAHREEIEPHLPCFLPDAKWRDVAFSKNAAYRHVEAIGVATPTVVYPRSQAEALLFAKTLGYPVVVKGERGSAGRRVRFSLGPRDLCAHYEEIDALERAEGGALSLQEYVDGPGYVVHALFFHGRPMAICAHRKDRELPVGRGVTSAATTVHEPELVQAALAIFESLRWHGLAKLDFKRDRRDGRFKFIELDPRVSASIDITRAAGVDQVAMLCALAEGKQVQPRLEYRAGVRYVWVYPRDVVRQLATPWRIPLSLLGALHPDCHLDLELGDVRCTARAIGMLLRQVKKQLSTRALWKQLREAEALDAFLSRARQPALAAPPSR